MALGYSYQSILPLQLIGSKTTANVVTGNLLTSAYGGAGNTAHFNTASMSKVNFSIYFALGAAETSNVLHFRVQSSSDETNWYQQINSSVSAGVTTVAQAEYQFTGASTAGGPYLISLPLDVADKWLQVSVYESGVSSNYGNCYVEVMLSGTNH